MQKADLTPVKISDLNQEPDWLEHLFYDGCVLHTPRDRVNYRQFLTFVEESLIRVTYESQQNAVAFEYVPTHRDSDREIDMSLAADAFETVKAVMEEFENDSEEVAIRYQQGDFYIKFYFYNAL